MRPVARTPLMETRPPCALGFACQVLEQVGSNGDGTGSSCRSPSQFASGSVPDAISTCRLECDQGTSDYVTFSLHSAMHAGQVSKVENCQKKRQAAVAVREQVGAAADDDAPGSSSDGSSSGRDAGPCSPGAWDHVPQPSARCERASVAECSRAVTTQRCHRGRLAHQRHRRERRRLRRCSQTHQEACRSTAAASDSSTVACGGREL